MRCATDVTGFGLLGHLHELAAASGLAARLDPGGAGRNREQVLSRGAALDPSLPEEWIALLTDPQTNGGLLLAVS